MTFPTDLISSSAMLMSEMFADVADSWDEQVVDSRDEVSSVSATLLSLRGFSLLSAVEAAAADFFF